MANEGLVSVIIPTFNRAYCLDRAVNSALGQTYRDVEVIVVDDGSTDATRELIARRYSGDPRVRYHHQQNTGISGARNSGLALANGAFVAFLDSDDDWAPWKLELQVACLRAHPELGMVWTDMIAVATSGEIESDAYLRRMYHAYRWFPDSESLFAGSEPLDSVVPHAAEIAPGRRFHFGDIGAAMLMGNLVHTSTVVMTRARAEIVKTFREDLRHAGEDYEFHLRTCRSGPVGYLDVASIRYQLGHADRATAPGNTIHIAENFLKVIEPIITSEGDQIKLPRRMREAALAAAHAWVGEVRLDMGDTAVARRELFRSLSHRPWQPRTARLLVGACLPTQLRAVARRLYRATRGVRAPANAS